VFSWRLVSAARLSDVGAFWLDRPRLSGDGGPGLTTLEPPVYKALLILVALVALASCGVKDEAAAKKCAVTGKDDGTLCQKCCQAAGSNGHWWQKGDGCKCF